MEISSPNFGVNIKKYLKPPPSFFLDPSIHLPSIFPSVRDQAAHPAIHHGVAKSKGQIKRFTYDGWKMVAARRIFPVIKKMGSRGPNSHDFHRGWSSTQEWGVIYAL